MRKLSSFAVLSLVLVAVAACVAPRGDKPASPAPPPAASTASPAVPAAAPAAASASLPAIPPLRQASNDTASYRRLVLENGLKVILLSDPKLNKSSASIAVGVGNLKDPMERQGLAHFLEHMLFLGTEKYPDEAEYGNYLKTNGGYSNAYTSRGHTNYHFEIRHEAFEGAIDRFSQFFIAPLFTAEFTDREMNAVNSENQKNLENDMWRQYQLANSLYRPDHPANRFGTGSRETLGGVTREELLKFYESYYSANQMTLALTGRATLDELEKWARQYFSPIVNRNLPTLRYPSDLLEGKDALRLVHVEPVKDLRELVLWIPVPGFFDKWAAKPERLISFLVGYEGEGSILSALKAEGLATGMGSGIWDETADYGMLPVNISLTPAGQEKYQRVLEIFYSGIETMRRAGFPAVTFQERATMAGLDELYADKGEGADRATFLANQVMNYPIEVAEREPYLWLQRDAAAYLGLLDHVRPENTIAMLVAKGVPTDRTEKYYGTKYSYTEITGPAFEALARPAPVAAIHVPKPNPFIPTKSALLDAPADVKDPQRLIDEPGLSLFYLPDAEFRRPMVAQVYRFRLPRELASVETAVLLRYYATCVNEALNEVAYTAAEAGLKFQLGASLEGVTVTIEGYDESAPRLLEVVAKNLIAFELSEERFTALKDKIVRDLANFPRADAWQILAETRRAVVREFHYRPDEQLEAARTVTLAQVREFAARLYSRGRVEALIHGNVTADDAVAATRRLVAALHSQAIAPADVLRRRLLTMAPGSTILTTEKLVVNNSAYRQEYLLGEATPEIRAATMMLANLIEEPFYSELRTRQQLGYIVFGGAGDEENSCFAFFIIQSGDHPAGELRSRAEAFIAQIPGMLPSLTEEDWATLVGGVRAELEKKDKSIAERAGCLFGLAYDYDGDWDRREETLAALLKLNKERLAEILAAALAPETRRMRTFLGFSRDHEMAEPVEPTIGDRALWKKGQAYE
ncbi:MAG: insulinase family protein [Opitutaceae bacterium]|nr:insulinase family protein [Opitutaceae bacterium]